MSVRTSVTFLNEIGHHDRRDETPNPLDIKLRRHVKGEIFAQLRKEDYSELQQNFPDATLVLYGSTLLRQMVEHDGVRIPFAGLRSSDIDIGCYMHQGSSTTTSKEEFEKHISPLLRNTLHDGGFDIVMPQHAIGDSQTITFPNDRIPALGPHVFCGDFYVVKRFSRPQVEAILKDDPDYDKLKPYIDEHFKKKPVETIYLAMSCHPEHFPLILEPTPLFPKDNGHAGQGDGTPGSSNGSQHFLGRAKRYDLIAGGLARNMGAHPKPTDVFNIYNLIKATDADGKPFIRRDDNTLDLIRLLALSYTLCGPNALSYENPHLLDHFANTPENRQRFIDATKNQIVDYRQEELYARLPEIYAEVDKFVHQIFRVRQNEGPTFGPMNLGFAEAQFIREFNGQKLVPKKPAPQGRWSRLMNKQAAPAPDYTVQPPPDDSHEHYKLDTALLQTAYPRLFEQFPTLKDSLVRNSLLQSMLMQNHYGQEVSEPMLE